jgi:hypothetical protein
MASITIKNIEFTNVPKKKLGVKLSNMITQSNIPAS